MDRFYVRGNHHTNNTKKQGMIWPRLAVEESAENATSASESSRNSDEKKRKKEKKRANKLEKELERVVARETEAKKGFDERAKKTTRAYEERIERIRGDLRKREELCEEQKNDLEREKKRRREYEMQRDELRETLKIEREKFESDAKLLRFAFEDAAKELEIVKQSYREEKENDEQIILSLRDALDAAVAEKTSHLMDSTFSPPATPRSASKPPLNTGPKSPRSPSVVSQITQKDKDEWELEIATQKELANKAKEKADRAIATARVAMEAAASRAKTDGAKINELEKLLLQARQESSSISATTTTGRNENDKLENAEDEDDDSNNNDIMNYKNITPEIVDDLKMRIEKLESHCADASKAAKDAADALDAANEELTAERMNCSQLERELLTISNDFAILTEVLEKSKSELKMRDENLATLARELEMSLALTNSPSGSALTTTEKKKQIYTEVSGRLLDNSYDSDDDDENDLSMTTGNETMASLRAELNSLRQIHDASERRANNYAERSKSAELARDSAIAELESLKREKLRLEERLENIEDQQATPRTPKVKPALLKELEQTKTTLQKEVETLEGNVFTMSSELTKIREEKTAEVKKLQEQLEETKALFEKSKIAAKKETNAVKKETETRLLEQMEALREELEASNQHREEINEQREKAEKDAKEAVTRFMSLESDKNAEISKFNEKVEAVTIELQAKIESCKHLERQLEMATQAQKTQSKAAAKEVERAYAKKIKDLENEISTALKLRDDADRAKNDLKIEIERIKIEFAAYKSSVADKERDENLKSTTANYYEKMQAIRAAEELRAERNDLAQDLEDARTDFMRSIREQTTRAEEAEAALEDAKLSSKIASDAARMESMEATSLARKHADEVAQARIALADARKHAAGAEKRADIAISRVERRCKEIETRAEKDADRLTTALDAAEKKRKNAEEKAAHVDVELANAKGLVQRLADGLRDVRVKKEQAEKHTQKVHDQLAEAQMRLEESKRIEEDKAKFSDRIKELEEEVKQLGIKAKRAEAAMIEAEKHAEHADEAFDRIRQLEQEVSDLDARRSQAEAALKTTSGDASEAFRALETENLRLEKRVKQTWQALQGAHAVAEQTKRAARDAVRTARQAAGRAEKEAAIYRDRAEKAEVAKVEAMHRADSMISDAQQQADEYANEKLEEEKRKTQILEEKLREAQIFSKNVTLPNVKSQSRSKKSGDGNTNLERMPSMPKINVGREEAPRRKLLSNQRREGSRTAQLDDEMADADAVLQEYLSRSRENSLRSSSPRSTDY